jgi:hypothetical protein
LRRYQVHQTENGVQPPSFNSAAAALMAIGAQRKGFPLSNGAVAEIVGLDLLGAAIALVGIIALALRSSAGLWLAGLVVVETIADVGIAIRRRRRGPLNAEPTGLLWWFIAVYVPLMIASLPVLSWLLLTRGGILS